MKELVAEILRVFAVLQELHRPVRWSRLGGGSRCKECLQRWPCKTWKVLARGEEEGQT